MRYADANSEIDLLTLSAREVASTSTIFTALRYYQAIDRAVLVVEFKRWTDAFDLLHSKPATRAQIAHKILRKAGIPPDEECTLWHVDYDYGHESCLGKHRAIDFYLGQCTPALNGVLQRRYKNFPLISELDAQFEEYFKNYADNVVAAWTRLMRISINVLNGTEHSFNNATQMEIIAPTLMLNLIDPPTLGFMTISPDVVARIPRCEKKICNQSNTNQTKPECSLR
ncbi:MAG: hypothetical protein H7240_07435 [Glaciimonas sp.]|nr:hypothetical protein [Glaciimonas sp.]